MNNNKTSFTEYMRKNIGSIISFFCFFILAIVTYGDIVDIATAKYWQNVWANLTQIGIYTVCATFLQVMIRQGLQEQALNNGMNTEDTKSKYEEHKEIRNKLKVKETYLPYFLVERNERETKQKKRDFIVNNFFKTENDLLMTANKKIIKNYNKLIVSMRPTDIKWTSSKIEYDNYGRIVTIDKHRKSRAMYGLLTGVSSMFFVSLLARDLFISISWSSFFHSTITLITYLFVIVITVAFSAIREYEYGKFGIAVSLEEVNKIWEEFDRWEVPQNVIDEVVGKKTYYLPPAKIESKQEIKTMEGNESNGQTEQAAENNGTDIQEQSSESKVVETTVADSVVVTDSNNIVNDMASTKE